MGSPDLSIVTGALSYSGKYITRKLLAAGQRVKTITGHPDRANPFGAQVEVAPFRFEDLGGLIETLRGATTLYNTYWVRFPMKGMTYEKATENSKVLIRAAEEAGIKRIVHVSIVKPSKDSPFGYYRGKAEVEETIQASSLSYAILRPTVFFGGEDILINNISWSLRFFPAFPIAGKGDYRIQPIFVEDFAEIAVQQGQATENVVWDVVGPEQYTFRELLRMICRQIGRSALLIPVAPFAMYWGARMIGLLMRDVMLTKDEVGGLMAGLLASDEEPRGATKLSEWIALNQDLLGTVYASELKRR
ncbi:MAG: epimerase [Armatimonadetes bacterium]|nr:epimerase [Armatimonadota bacterium]